MATRHFSMFFASRKKSKPESGAGSHIPCLRTARLLSSSLGVLRFSCGVGKFKVLRRRGRAEQQQSAQRSPRKRTKPACAYRLFVFLLFAFFLPVVVFFAGTAFFGEPCFSALGGLAAFGGFGAFAASAFGTGCGTGATAAFPFFLVATGAATGCGAAAAALAARPRFGAGGGGGGGGANGFRNLRISVCERNLPSSSNMKTSLAIFGYSGIGA